MDNKTLFSGLLIYFISIRYSPSGGEGLTLIPSVTQMSATVKPGGKWQCVNYNEGIIARGVGWDKIKRRLSRKYS